MEANYVQRLRLKFSKSGPARFISHLDLARALERSLLRAQIPVAYSQGFNRRPRMQFAAALPLGITSEGELADIWLAESILPEEVHQRLNARIAPGINVSSIIEVPLSQPSLQTQTAESVYVADIPESVNMEALAERIMSLMAADSHLMERIRGKKRKQIDLRPLIIDLQLQETAREQMTLLLQLYLRPDRNGRPDDVLRALEMDPLEIRIHRTRIRLQSEIEPVRV